MSLYNLVKMSTTTTGTGTVTLGSAISGFLSFADSGVSDGDEVTYSIREGSNSEIGVGTYTSAGTTLSRDTILNSTNAPNAIALSGSAEVIITAASKDFPGMFATRAAFVTWAANNTRPDGALVFAEGQTYEADSGTTDISDLSGWKPVGAVSITHFGASTGASDAANNTAITAALTYAASVGERLYIPPGSYGCTSITWDDDVDVFGAGRIEPSSDSNAELYGRQVRFGTKRGETFPVLEKGGLIIGGEGPTKYGMALVAQRVGSMDFVPTRDMNTNEIQFYSSKISGNVSSNGSDTVTYVSGFSGNFDDFYAGEQFFVGNTEYTIAAVTSTTMDLYDSGTTTPATIATDSGQTSYFPYETSDAIIDISGTAITIPDLTVSETFRAGTLHLVISGTRYDFTRTDESSGTAGSAPGNGTGVAAIIRRKSETLIALRLQKSQGFGTEETLTVSAEPDCFRIRVGYSADGIGRPSPLYLFGLTPDDDPAPNNDDPRTMLGFDANGRIGLRTQTPEADVHLYRNLDPTAAADDTSTVLARLEGRYNSLATRGGLDIIHRNDGSAIWLQGLSGSTMSTAAIIELQPSGGDLAVDRDTLYVDSANDRIGINTNSPSVALEVNGTIVSDNLGATGTFTPNLEFGGASTGWVFSTNNGTYQRIGARVFYEIDVAVTTVGSATGAITIDNMPVAAASGAVGMTTDVVFVSSGTLVADPYAIVAASGTTLSLYKDRTNTAQVAINHTIFAASATMQISGWYRVA